MAWRIADYIERGEIDNRTKDRITGTIHLCGLNAPIQLELTGNPYRDLAGQLLRFINPKPKPIPEHLADIAVEQTGVVGDMTAARKVKILDIEDGELEHYYTNKIPMPYHWGNSVYLEWHSVRNGRVVIESADYLLEVLPEATWQMSEAEEAEQLEANGRAMVNFMDQLAEAANAAEADEDDEDEAMNEPPDPEDLREHPLAEHCHELGSRIHHEIEQNAWLPEGAPEEHPLYAFKHGIWFASAKLAGALNGRRDEWPPEPDFAGDSLVRLKKARNYLKDSLNALEAIEAEKLTNPSWWPPLRQELQGILENVQSLIEEVRAVLKGSKGMD